MKGKQKQNQKGITLIALVITIIVLLILAGVTINIVFNDGIAEKSQTAVDTYSEKEKNEMEQLEYLSNRLTQITGNLDNTKGTENQKIVTDADYSYTNPVIPAGFKTSNEGASWDVRDGKVIGWNDGLVIEDGEGNQFVWVPVDGTNVTYDYHYSVESTGSKDLEQSLPTGITSEEAQIEKYKGFYIARYEAGIPESMTTAISTEGASARNVSGTPVSKKNQVPWNCISWSQSKTNAESMYTLAKTNNKVQSTLITDRMWETTMQWLENSGLNVKSDSREWGNYYDAPVTGITEYSTNYEASWTTVASTTKGTSDKWLLKTGHTEYTSRKNIYDLAGNLWERTNAKYSSSSSNYVGRGGCYSNNGTNYPAAYRVSYSGKANYYVGFRVGLFVQ